MKRNILISFMIIALAATMIAGATTAYFSDTETSNGNTLTAGTLDLKIYGEDDNVVMFNVTNMKPGDVLSSHYTFSNAGTIDGYLDISKITVANLENDLIEPEAEAGDTTFHQGELGDITYIHLFYDNNINGTFEAGTDEMFYAGAISALPANLDLNKFIPAGGEIRVVGNIISWPSSPNDNLAQSDTVNFDFEFTLNQVA